MAGYKKELSNHQKIAAMEFAAPSSQGTLGLFGPQIHLQKPRRLYSTALCCVGSEQQGLERSVNIYIHCLDNNLSKAIHVP